MKENLKRLLKYVRKNPAFYSALLIGVGRAIFYFYQVGYYYYFNVSIRKINIINGNVAFQLLLYVMLAGLMLFSYFMGYTYYKKRKLLLYLGCFLLVLFVFCFALVLKISWKIPTISEVISIGTGSLLISLVITVTLNAVIITHALAPSLNDNIYITEIRLKEAKNKRAKNKLQIKLDKLYTLKEETEIKAAPENLSNTSMIEKVSVCAGIICFCFLFFLIIGYFSASSQREFKIVSNQHVELDADSCRDGFVVVFEDGGEYVLSPYEYSDGEISIYTGEQVTVGEKDTFTVERRFKKVACKV